MEVTLLAIGELTELEIEAWQSLSDRSVEPNPCFEPAFLLPALEYLDPERSVRLLVITEGVEMRFCLPVVPRTRWKRLPFDALVSWHHSYSVLGTPLVDRDQVRATVERFVAYLTRDAGHPRLSVLEWIGAGAVTDALAEFCQPVVYSSFERPVLCRRADGEYLQALSRHRRREVARRRRQLEEAFGAVRTIDRSDEEDARERFLDLEQSGWKGAAGTAMASTPSHAAFFRAMAHGFAEARRLELQSLETADGKVLAMAVRLLADGGVFQLKIAYDESYREFGPGRVLELELLRTFHERADEQWVDSCTDAGNEFKAALFPGRRRIDTVVIPAEGRLNRAIASAVPRMRAWRNALRRRG
jgi:CelD/BcsL family acetyltransferase involved in cellulose biosynthesis